MAKVRIGFSTQFELENELVGIGTDNPTNTLQALGNIHSSNAKAIGVSTLTTFDGFVDTKASILSAIISPVTCRVSRAESVPIPTLSFSTSNCVEKPMRTFAILETS